MCGPGIAALNFHVNNADHTHLKQHKIVNSAGVQLCLHHLPARNDPVATVVLAHGMFSNYRACRGLAQYLSGLDLDCWLLDSQGHGASQQSVTAVDFEAMCLDDTGAVLDFFNADLEFKDHKASADHDSAGGVYAHRSVVNNGCCSDVCNTMSEKTDSNRCARRKLPLWWVGHSGGGLAIAMYLARNPQRQWMLDGIVTMASQATDAGFNFRRRMTLRMSRILVRLLRVAPGKVLGLGPENESMPVMDQWLRWSLAGRWSGVDNFDYCESLGAIQLPSLSIAARADPFIAPVSGCEKMHDLLGGEDKTFMVFGKSEGYLEDYTHARLVSSRNASVDVWPVIGRWIIDRLKP